MDVLENTKIREYIDSVMFRELEIYLQKEVIMLLKKAFFWDFAVSRTGVIFFYFLLSFIIIIFSGLT